MMKKKRYIQPRWEFNDIEEDLLGAHTLTGTGTIYKTPELDGQEDPAIPIEEEDNETGEGLD